MRCHLPPVGLRFYQDETLVCTFSICWKCNNAYGERQGQPFYFHFDGQSPAAQELLTVIQTVVGPEALRSEQTP